MDLIEAINNSKDKNKFLVDYYLEDTDRVFYYKNSMLFDDSKPAHEIVISYVSLCNRSKKCPGFVSKECSGYEYDCYNRTIEDNDMYFDCCHSSSHLYLDKECSIEVRL